MTTRLERMLEETPYAGYAYAYPHKSAYRRLDPPVPLGEAWAGEEREALFLYLHVPFCEMRCGFCNLFTTANPPDALVPRYLETMERQARAVREAIGPLRVAQMAIGGGTPTYLEPDALHRLFDLAAEWYGADPRDIPASVETSPQTATAERLRALKERGVNRVSMGVQSFVEAEAAAAGRAQRTSDVERTLEAIREAGFPTLNLDLMYGLPGQTVESWTNSLRAALRFSPEELYLYPLYVRPLTGLGRTGVRAWDDQRLACYRAGRDLLRAEGYVQISMRMFQRGGEPEESAVLADLRRAGSPSLPAIVYPEAFRQVANRPESSRREASRSPDAGRDGDPALRAPGCGDADSFAAVLSGSHRGPQDAFRVGDRPRYCCQDDGMIGVGCGARSYTHGLHYSSEYAVGRTGVREILDAYLNRPDEAFRVADYGVRLDLEEQQRRYVIQSLLQVDGLGLRDYQERFGSQVLEDLPELAELPEHGLAVLEDGHLRLTEVGLERSDMIGPWLYSEAVRRRSEEFSLR